MELTVKRLRSADGTEIYADAVGDPSKPAIVFLHGFGLSSIVFESNFCDSRWTDEVYMVRYDMRGHGRSGKPMEDDAWQSKRFAEDFDAVVEGFKLHRPFFAGWSLGGTTSADILSFHPPSYISGIIYITPSPYIACIPAGVALPTAQQVIGATIQSEDVVAFKMAAFQFPDNNIADPSKLSHIMRQAFVGEMVAQLPAIAAKGVTRTQDEAALLRATRAGEVPVLLFTAGKDMLVDGSVVADIVKDWKATEIVHFENSGHAVFIEAPDEFRDRVLDWTSRVRKA